MKAEMTNSYEQIGVFRVPPFSGVCALDPCRLLQWPNKYSEHFAQWLMCIQVPIGQNSDMKCVWNIYIAPLPSTNQRMVASFDRNHTKQTPFFRAVSESSRPREACCFSSPERQPIVGQCNHFARSWGQDGVESTPKCDRNAWKNGLLARKKDVVIIFTLQNYKFQVCFSIFRFVLRFWALWTTLKHSRYERFIEGRRRNLSGTAKFIKYSITVSVKRNEEKSQQKLVMKVVRVLSVTLYLSILCMDFI